MKSEGWNARCAKDVVENIRFFDVSCRIDHKRVAQLAHPKGGGMLAEEVFALGLGLTAPWRSMSQRFDTDHSPAERHLEVGADSGAEYPSPTCGAACKAHDLKEDTRRHLNFFLHHCYRTARVPLNKSKNMVSGEWVYPRPERAVDLCSFSSKWSCHLYARCPLTPSSGMSK